ncbi:hypothetical protein HGRIS_007621 [Hohenbuehelia grisea]|uniref:Uncharacterized protein n=1 Tax=Hohenbuehelia grisea TaxID=104357 RepID=A0ABR3J5K2_9AGAR
MYLQPFTIETCQEYGLRERRRSSLRSLASVPRLFTTADTHLRSDSAVEDEQADPDALAKTCLVEEKAASQTSLSPLPHAHLCTSSTTVHLRHTSEYLPSLSYTPDPHSATVTEIPSIKRDGSAEPSLHVYLEDDRDFGSVAHERQTLRLLSGYFMYFLCGWGDGVTGTVIPYFEAEFGLTSLTSSLLFTGSTVGFFAGTLLVEHIVKLLSRFEPSRADRSLVPALFATRPAKIPGTRSTGCSLSQGRYLTLTYFSVLHAMFFVMMGTRGGYAILLLSYAVAAFARAMVTGEV